MNRHTKLLNEFSRSKSQAELLNKMQKSRKAIEINANGTSGYKIKEGANAGKVLKHLKKTSENIYLLWGRDNPSPSI